MIAHKNIAQISTGKIKVDFIDELLNKIERITEDPVDELGLHETGLVDISIDPVNPGKTRKKKDKMVNTILRNINVNVKKQNFEKAIRLRELLYNIDPKAIKAIFSSGQIIEKEMYRSELTKSNQGISHSVKKAPRTCI